MGEVVISSWIHKSKIAAICKSEDSTLLVEDLCSRYSLKNVVYYGKQYLFAA